MASRNRRLQSLTTGRIAVPATEYPKRHLTRLIPAGLTATAIAALATACWLVLALVARPMPKRADLRLIRGMAMTAYSDCEITGCAMYLTIFDVPGTFIYPETQPQVTAVERTLRPGQQVVLGVLPTELAAGQQIRIWHAEAGDRVIAPFDEVIAIVRIHRAAAALLALALIDVAALAGIALGRRQGFGRERVDHALRRASTILRHPGVVGLATLGAAIGYWWAAQAMYWLSVLDASGASNAYWFGVTLVSGAIALGAMARWREIPRSLRWSLLAGGFLFPVMAYLLGRHAVPIATIARFAGDELAGAIATLLVLCSPAFSFVLAPVISVALPVSAELRRAALIGLGAASLGSTLWLVLVVPRERDPLLWLGLSAGLSLWSLYVGLRGSLERERFERLAAEHPSVPAQPATVLTHHDLPR